LKRFYWLTDAVVPETLHVPRCPAYFRTIFGAIIYSKCPAIARPAFFGRHSSLCPAVLRSSAGTYPTIFCALLKQTQCPGPPSELSALLHTLSDQLVTDGPSISLSNISMVVAIPLAAVLLEYPVAYVPIPEHATAFLAGVPLKVYECTLTWKSRGGGQSHCRLLQFSCPVALHHVLSESALVERFEPRLRRFVPCPTLEIQHKIQTLDRVAL
jgi:hypothetical protein